MTRCSSTLGTWLCQDVEGHDGDHWVDLGWQTEVLRWGTRVLFGCFSPWCDEPPGHDGPHRHRHKYYYGDRAPYTYSYVSDDDEA